MSDEWWARASDLPTLFQSQCRQPGLQSPGFLPRSSWAWGACPAILITFVCSLEINSNKSSLVLFLFLILMLTCSLYLSALIPSSVSVYLIAYEPLCRMIVQWWCFAGWVMIWIRQETAVLWRGFLGRAGDSHDLCLCSPDALLSYCSGSGLVIFWLETLPRKGGTGSSRRPLVWSGLCPFIPSSVPSPIPCLDTDI